MKLFEIYELKDGILVATGITARGNKLSHVEDELYRAMKFLDNPCTILFNKFPIKEFIPKDHENNEIPIDNRPILGFED